jgi:BirA family biotin operon repressor/biotin-[acetyl-CoA-carboxylase] ligase
VSVYTYKSIDSTNDEARRRIAAAVAAGSGAAAAESGAIPFGDVIVADEQTGGRGRRGRGFFSPAADSVYLSFILRPAARSAGTTPAHSKPDDSAGTTPAKSANITLVTILAAVCVCEAIEAATDQRPLIKWVNDIYIEGKKVCGILTEGVAGGAGATHPAIGGITSLVLGIGVNINVPPEGFPAEIRDTAGSVRMDPERRRAFTEDLIRRVLAGHEALLRGVVPIEAYRARSFVCGKDITILRADGSKTAARAESITDDGGLAVAYADGTREVLNSGEISIRV